MCVVRFIADTHFGHTNLIKNMRNMSVEEHDNLIINNWNRVVSKRDITYVIGDFVFEKHNLIQKYVSQLNGEIRIIGGNHDNIRCCKEFAKLGIVVLGCLEYKGFIITHIPVNQKELTRWASAGQSYHGNIHGHIHGESLDYPYFNVCCEKVNYTPKTLEEILTQYENVSK